MRLSRSLFTDPLIVCLIAGGSLPVARADPGREDVPPRIWIVPFSHAEREPEGTAEATAAGGEVTGVAIAEILTVLVSHSTGTEVVDRDHLDRVLAEHSLSEKGLLFPEDRLKIGRLLGATVLVSGSFMEEEHRLMVTAHATDISSSRLVTSHRDVGTTEDLAGLLKRLERRLTEDLRAWRPAVWSGRTDAHPIESLFFLEGLNHYHAGRYHHALGEFLKASRERPLHRVSRFWMARAYLAQRDYGHAYIELRRLQLHGAPHRKSKAIEQYLGLCTANLSDAAKELFDELLSRQRTKED